MTPLGRAWGFFLVCIPVRLLIAGVTLSIREPLLASPFLLVGGSFFLQWLKGKEVGFFGGPAYWRDARILHAYLWTSAGVCILVGGELVKLASGLLFLDTFVGVFIRLALGPYLCA